MIEGKGNVMGRRGMIWIEDNASERGVILGERGRQC